MVGPIFGKKKKQEKHKQEAQEALEEEREKLMAQKEEIEAQLEQTYTKEISEMSSNPNPVPTNATQETQQDPVSPTQSRPQPQPEQQTVSAEQIVQLIDRLIISCSEQQYTLQQLRRLFKE